MKWSLYDVTKDWTQNDDVADANPTKLKEMQGLFWVEARKYRVLPLDASGVTRIIEPKPSIVAGRNDFVYTKPVLGIPQATAPSVLSWSYVITAEIDVPADAGNGMLVTAGGRFGGYGFYLPTGKPVFSYNLLDLGIIRLAGEKPLSPGEHTVVFDFTYDGPGLAEGGTGVIEIDGI